MAAITDDVLLSVSNVKNKKCDGSLCLLSERIAWMPSGKSSLLISHYYTDIKVQKVSPDTKEKVQLQILLHTGGANTFLFNNPNGRDAQIKDRDSVKELLQHLLVDSNKRTNNDLEAKNRMLQEDPNLYQLYKSLVAGGILSAEEFWANKMNKLSVGETSKQEIGASAGFLADIEKQCDGENVRYNLTVDIIDSIFKTYPEVERKHAELVPEQMTEQEFWYQFCLSHYFHRDRTDGDTGLFRDCMKNDDNAYKKDLAALSEQNTLQNMYDPIEEDYASNDRTVSEAPLSKNGLLIRRLNMHSSMVLKSIKPKPDAPDKPDSSADSAMTSDLGVCTKSKRSADELDDCDEAAQGRPLKLSNIEAYRHGPIPIAADSYNTMNELCDAARRFTHDVMAWKRTPPNQLVSSTAALNVLWELSPARSLMQGSLAQKQNDAIPMELQLELKDIYSGLCELLRHFWTCFPVTSKELEDKVVRTEGCLRKFQKNKIPPFSEKVASFRLTIDLTSHMNSMLDKAYSKFSNWQIRKTTKRS